MTAWLAVSVLFGTLVPVAAAAAAQVVQVQSVDVSAVSVASLDATLPAAPTVGNHLIAVVVGGADSIDPPTGWSVLIEDETTDAASGIYWRKVEAGDSATATFTFSESEEHAATVFEYSGLADPPPDRSGSAQDASGSNTSLTVTADAANTTADSLTVVGVLGWHPDTEITWSAGYVEDVDGFNGSYMNYGTATRVSTVVETASVTATTASTMELYGVVGTFQAAAPTSTLSLVASSSSLSMTGTETPAAGSQTVAGSGGDDAADSMSIDVGTAGTHRVVAVYLDVESEGTDASGVSVDGKAATLVAVAENPDGVGNHSELWYLDEDDLGSSSGVVTVAAQGTTSLWGIQSLLLTGADQTGPHDFGIDDTSVSTDTIVPAAIDVPAGGAVVMVGGEGSQNRTVTSITSPLTVLESHDPNSADMFLAAGIETNAQAGKSYVMTLSSAHNRASGVVASWAPALGAVVATETVDLSTSDASDATFTATSDQPWLSATPATGSTGTSGVALAVSADPIGLAVGGHSGTITASAAGYDPTTIAVSYTVEPIGGTGVITQVQVADGSANYTTGVSATFLVAPSVGNHLIAVVASGAGTIDAATGWTAVGTDFTDAATGIYFKDAAATDTTVTFTFGGASEEHSLVVFEYSGLADPPGDQFGSAQDAGGNNDTIIVTAAGPNSQTDQLNVVGAMSWNPDIDFTWGSYTEAVDKFNGGYMNYGAATKITTAIETATTTVTVDSDMQLFATVATFTGEPVVKGVQSRAGAGSASSFTVSAGSTPSAGNLLVIGTATASPVSLGAGESSWIKAVSSDTSWDTVTLWYKIAEGDPLSDDTIGFAMTSTNQYSWVFAEYSAPAGWESNPLDVSGFEPMSGGTADDQVASGTTATPAGAGLGVAMFMDRNGSGPVPNLVFTGDYSLVDRAGTEYGNPWSLEGFFAADTQTSVSAQSTIASWDIGDTRIDRGGVIAVFQPVAGTSTPSLIANPTSVSVSGVENGPSVSDIATVSTSDLSAATYGVSDDALWLVVSPSSGTTPDVITVTADPTGLAAGTYDATITITATGYDPVGLPVTLTVDPEPGTAVITGVQSRADAGSAGSFIAKADVIPTAGNLLVIGAVGGGVVSIDPSESTWTKAQASSVDSLTLWYKIAAGDASDDNVTFTMSSANQYAWTYAEYESTTGWGTDPLDVSAFTAIDGAAGNQVPSGTTVTPAGSGLGVAVFRLRDGNGPVSSLGFTNGYGLVDRDGTEYGHAWSIEGIMAANTATTAAAQSTLASWTQGDTRIWRGGVIAVFQPVAGIEDLVDLALVKSVSDAAPFAGDSVTFSVVVSNDGSDDASGVIVNDLLTSGLGYVSHVASDGSYDPTTGVWNVGNLAAGASATLSVVTTVSALGTIVNTAEVTACDQADVDSVPGNADPVEDDYDTASVTAVASGSIGGQVWEDADADGVIDGLEPGIAGATVDLIDASSSNTIDTTVTDSSGNYSFGTLTAGDYEVVVNESTIPSDYLLTTASPAAIILLAGGSAADVDFGYVPAASIDGTVWNDWNGDGSVGLYEPFLQDVDVELRDGPSGPILDTATTDGSGDFSFIGVFPGSYEIDVVDSTLPVGSVLTTANDPFDANIAADETRLLAPVGYSVPADLSLNNSASDSTPAVGATVTLTATVGNDGPATASGIEISYALPDALQHLSHVASSGTYDPVSGMWSIGEVTSGTTATLSVDAQVASIGASSIVAEVVDVDQLDPDSVAGNSNVTEDDYAVVTLDPIGVGSIGGTVWDDADADTIQDVTEPGLFGVTITLVEAGTDATLGTIDDISIDDTVTDGSGAYLFTALSAGLYGVAVDPTTVPAGYLLTSPSSSADITLASGQSVGGADFGYVAPATIEGFVFDDADADGIADPAEPGLAAVTVELFDGTGTTLIATATTPTDGTYTFAGLFPGDYRVDVDETTLPIGYEITTANDPADVTLTAEDAQVVATGFVATADISLAQSVSDPTPTLGDTVTFEITVTNGGPATATGLQLIDLLPTGLVYTSATPSQGTYDQGTGLWTIGIIAPASIATLTLEANVDDSGTLINTADLAAMTEHDPDSIPGNDDPTEDDHASVSLDAGVGGSISGIVFADTDGNGTRDPAETGLEAVNVDLVSAGPDGILETADDTIVNTSTDTAGSYIFVGLTSGLYQVTVTAPNGSVPSTPETIQVTLAENDSYPTANFGYAPQSTITGLVWLDANANGASDAGELGEPDVDVALYDATGTVLVNESTTDATGTFVFSSLISGDYTVIIDQATLPTGAVLTTDAQLLLNLAVGEALADAAFGYVYSSDLSVSIAADNTNPSVGSNVTLTLAVANNGPAEGASAEVTYVIPPELGYVSDTGGGAFDEATGVWTLGPVPVGATVFLEVTAQVLVSGSITNIAEIASAAHLDPDSTPGNSEPTEDDYSATVLAVAPGGFVGGSIWDDLNRNGIVDQGEPGLSYIPISLIEAGPDGLFDTPDDTTIGLVSTDIDGSWSFGGLAAGLYRIDPDQAALPSNYMLYTGSDPYQMSLATDEILHVSFGYVTLTISEAYDVLAVTTVAGDGADATSDGSGTSASFRQMGGIAVISDMGYLATDGSIRTVDLSTLDVGTLSGHPTETGCVNSSDPSAARFGNLGDIATDGNHLYVLEGYGGACTRGTIRKVDIATGSTTTLTTVTYGHHLTLASDGYLYVTNYSDGAISRVNTTTGAQNTFVTLQPTNTDLSWYEAVGYAITSDDQYLWVAVDDYSTYPRTRIERIDLSDASISTLHVDARVFPLDVLVSIGDDLYGTDRYDQSLLLRIAKTDGEVSGLAGHGSRGWEDGVSTNAWLSGVSGLASDGASLWIADSDNRRIRKGVPSEPLPSEQSGLNNLTVEISPADVTTFAGNGTEASVDGQETAASFDNVGDVVVVDGIVYVLTDGSIRRVDTNTGDVTTVAGSELATASGSIATDGYYLYHTSGFGVTLLRRTHLGTGATSLVGNSVADIAMGADGALYGIDRLGLQRIDPRTGVETLITPYETSATNYGSVATDSDSVWVSTEHNGVWQIDRIDPTSGAVTTVATSQHQVLDLMSAGSYLYVSAAEPLIEFTPTATHTIPIEDLAYGEVIRRYDKTTGQFEIIAGTRGIGYNDGSGTDAWFSTIDGIASDGAALFVSDGGNLRLRRAVDTDPLPAEQSPSANVTVDSAPGHIDTVAGNGTDGSANATGTAAQLRSSGGVAANDGTTYLGSYGAIRQLDVASGSVTTLAGATDGFGCVDSLDPSTVRFTSVYDVTTDGYYLYTTNGCRFREVRRTSLASGATSTVVSIPGARHTAIGPDGYLYVTVGSRIERVDTLADATSTFVTLEGQAYAIAADDDALWVTIELVGGQRRVERIDLDDASTTTVVSSAQLGLGSLASTGAYLYSDGGRTGTAVLQIAKSDGTLSVAAGAGERGFADGAGDIARLAGVAGIASDGTQLWIADSGNHRVRTMTPGSGTSTAAIGDLVWEDLDNDGVADPAEPGITGATVDVSGYGPTTSDSDGAYWAAGLAAGSHTANPDATTVPTGGTITTGNDPATVAIAGGESNFTTDFGYAYPTTPEVTVDMVTGSVTTSAGDGTDGTVDGIGLAASFSEMGSIDYRDALAYIGSAGAVRVFDPTTAELTTLAGHPTERGCVDSTDPGDVRFGTIHAVVVDRQYVYSIDNCDSSSMAYLRRTEIATGSTKKISAIPWAKHLTFGPDGYLYVTTGRDQTVLKVNPVSGSAEVFASLDGETWAIASDTEYLWVAIVLPPVMSPNNPSTEEVRRIEQISLETGLVSTLVTGRDLSLRSLESAGGYLYGDSGMVATYDAYNGGDGGLGWVNRLYTDVDGPHGGSFVRRYNKTDGTWTNIAGVDGLKTGWVWGTPPGHADGLSTDAWFAEIRGLVTDGTDLLVADSGNYRLRRISAESALPVDQSPHATETVKIGTASVVAGVGSGSYAVVDGVGSAASFRGVGDVVVHNGYAYVISDDTIRTVNLGTGEVTTLAGDVMAEGETTTCTDNVDPALAQFRWGSVGTNPSQEYSITTDGHYLYTNTCSQIRRTSLATGSTSMVADLRADDITVGPDGFLYATVSLYDGIIQWDGVAKIDPVNGTYERWAETEHAEGIAADDEYIWVTQWTSATRSIERISLADASVVRLASTTARVTSSIESAGEYLYVPVESYSYPYVASIRQYSKTTGNYVTIAGGSSNGYSNGVGSAAQFHGVNGLASDGDMLWIADNYNNRLRAARTSGFFAPGSFAFGWEGYGAWNGGINAGLGNYVTTEIDATVATVGPGLTIERTHNSLDSTYEGPFGVGWRYNYEMTWKDDGGGNIGVLFPDGRRELHTNNGDGTYSAPEGYFSKLEGTQATGFTLTLKDDTVYTLDADGKLTLITDTHGTTVTLAYDADDHLETITDDTSGRALHVTWTDDRITAITSDSVAAHGGALEWRYYYDDSNRLEQTCDPRDNTQDTGVCRLYEYNDDNQITKITKPEGNVEVELTYNTDQTIATRTDGENNLTSYDRSVENQVTTTDARQNTTTDVYDERFRLIESRDADGNPTTYEYDALGNRFRIIDANLNESNMTFDTDGNMLSIRNGENKTTWFQYDTDNNLIATRDGRSTSDTDDTYKTSFGYDNAGNKTSETDALGNTQTWEYTNGMDDAVGGGTVPAGLLEKYREARGNIGGVADDSYATTYTYYSNGDLASVTTPAGLETTYTYDELGRVITGAITDPVASISNQIIATYTYDRIGNIETVTGPTVTNPISSDQHQLKTTNAYDDNSNLVSFTETDEVGNDDPRITVLAYDDNDREIAVDDPENDSAHRLTRTYDAVGNVKTVTDQAGRTIETSYDNRNLATQVLLKDFDDGHGSPETDIVLSVTEYDEAGRKTSETDAEGRVTTWTYDDADRVLDVERLGVVDHDTQTRDVLMSRTSYDDAGNVKAQTTGDGTNGQAVVTNDYDEAARLTQSTLTGTGGVNRLTTFQYDAAGNVRFAYRSEDGRTETTESVFNVAGRMIKSIVDPDGLALTTWYGYDARSNQTSVREPRSTDGNDTEYLTRVDYDILSRPTTVTAPTVDVEDGPGTVTQEQPSTSTGYDTFSNPTHRRDERDNETVSNFDAIDRVVRIDHPTYTPAGQTAINPYETFGYDPVGNLTSETSRRGNTTTYEFDDMNRAVRQINPVVTGETAHGVSFVYYNLVGEQTKTKNATGAVTRFEYDDLGRLNKQTVVVSKDPVDDEYITVFDYDDLGNLTYMTDPALIETLSVFNAAGELLSVTDDLGLISSFEYDVAGRQTLATDAEGRSTKSTYDLAGRLTEVRELLPEPDVVTTYGYDEAGNRTSMTTARNNTTEWRYDALSRLTQVEVPNSPYPDIVTSYGYDEAGNVTRVTDGNTGAFYTTYNPWNLQETVIEPSTAQHTDPSQRTWTIIYDAGGLPVGEDQPGGIEIIRVFDQLGRMTSETGDDGTSVAKTFGFDLNGRLTTVSHPSGVLTYEYDDRGLMTEAAGPAGATSFTYDELGRMEARNDPTGAFIFEWTDRSELRRLTDPLSGKTLEYTWNDASQLDLITYSNADLERDYEYSNRGLLESDVMRNGTVTLASYSYTYDEDGNLETAQVNLPGNSMSGSHGYGYDDAGRLTEWTHDGTTTGYGWDGAGNRTTAGSDTFTYDARNRLTSGPEGDYIYTPRGDLTQISDGTTTVTYGFDPLGRLTDYNSQVAYTYDGLDRVATRGTDTFEYIGTMLDPVDDGTFEYSRSPGGRLIAQTDGTTDLLVGLDRHGDLAYLLDPATGALTDTAMFDPFGDLIDSTGTTDPTVGFQGDYTDPTSDEVWMGARWYSGADAVFRSRDTVFGELATPISLNRYTYAYASPLNYWDPDGQLPAGVWLDGEYGSSDAARAAGETTSATRAKNRAKNRQNMPWEFEDAAPTNRADDSLRAAMAEYFRGLYTSTKSDPETASELAFNAVFVGGVGTGLSAESSNTNALDIAKILSRKGISANPYSTTWPSSTTIFGANDRLSACHGDDPDVLGTCFYEEYGPTLADNLRSSYGDLDGTTVLYAHSEGVAASSYAFAEDENNLVDVFDMVVLIAGAGAKVGGFESYIEAGGTVVVIYDNLDPVVLRSRALLPALGNMQSPPNIDGNRPYVVPNAGHSGLLDPRNEVISRELGAATRNQLDSGRVIRYTPGVSKRSNFGSGSSEIEYPYLNLVELQGVTP